MNTRFKGLKDKQVAIAEHRKMWDWIANHLNPDIGIDVQNLKCKYLEEHEKEHEIEGGCYLCDFVGCVLNSPDNNHIPNPENEFSTCEYCPVTWGTENPDDKCISAIDKDTGERRPGLYKRVMLACEKRDWGTARELAMKIRDLPERENFPRIHMKEVGNMETRKHDTVSADMMIRNKKKSAIEEHRNMWRWIADQLTPETGASIMALKRQYLRLYRPNCTLWNHCFLCDFARWFWTNNADYVQKILGNFVCRYCPVCWGKETRDSSSNCDHIVEIHKENGKYIKYVALGLYGITCDAAERQEWELARTIALQIANLPERELPL